MSLFIESMWPNWKPVSAGQKEGEEKLASRPLRKLLLGNATLCILGQTASSPGDRAFHTPHGNLTRGGWTKGRPKGRKGTRVSAALRSSSVAVTATVFAASAVGVGGNLDQVSRARLGQLFL